ncbi:MAG: hypothetical protein WCQ47_03335 [bacterium]
MKKLLIILTLSLIIPSLSYGASATVGGTLKVYTALSAIVYGQMIFPSQFVGSLPANVTNIEGLGGPSGIPSASSNWGRAGWVRFTGAGNTQIDLTNPTSLSLTNGGSTISNIPICYWVNTSYTETSPTWPCPTQYMLNGSWSGSGQIDIYIRGVIPSGTNLIAGTYTGTHTVTANY